LTHAVAFGREATRTYNLAVTLFFLTGGVQIQFFPNLGAEESPPVARI
jgi:hypothetical protein